MVDFYFYLQFKSGKTSITTGQSSVLALIGNSRGCSVLTVWDCLPYCLNEAAYQKLDIVGQIMTYLR